MCQNLMRQRGKCLNTRDCLNPERDGTPLDELDEVPELITLYHTAPGERASCYPGMGLGGSDRFAGQRRRRKICSDSVGVPNRTGMPRRLVAVVRRAAWVAILLA